MTSERQPGEWAIEDKIHRGWLFFSFPEALWTGKLLHGDEIHRAESWVQYWFPIAAYGLQNRNDYSSGSQKSLKKGAGLHSFWRPQRRPPPFCLLQLLDTTCIPWLMALLPSLESAMSHLSPHFLWDSASSSHLLWLWPYCSFLLF